MSAQARLARRSVCRCAFLFVAWFSVCGHTPYGQWGVYRRRHLLILTSKRDIPSFALGERVAGLLAAQLPASKARVARAPDEQRIASLISSAQLDVALMRPAAARALRAGAAPFADYGPVALRALVSLDDFVMVCRSDMPERHAYAIAETLMTGGGDELKVSEPRGELPVHAGAATFYRERRRLDGNEN